MSSVWSSAVPQSGASPFQTTGVAPAPGEGAATRYQSVLQSANNARTPSLSGKAGATTTGAAASPEDSSSTTGTSDTGSAATITANDFLTLLVTEMQNQDPTSQQDPNEYINQLVSINSLEQLISINQNLTSVLGTGTQSPTTQSSPTGVSRATAATPATPESHSPASGRASAAKLDAVPATASRMSSSHAGNLPLPPEMPAARAVGRSLDGHARSGRGGHSIRDFPQQ